MTNSFVGLLIASFPGFSSFERDLLPLMWDLFCFVFCFRRWCFSVCTLNKFKLRPHILCIIESIPTYHSNYRYLQPQPNMYILWKMPRFLPYVSVVAFGWLPSRCAAGCQPEKIVAVVPGVPAPRPKDGRTKLGVSYSSSTRGFLFNCLAATDADSRRRLAVG